MTVQVAVLEHNAGPLRGLGDKADLDLAGPLAVGLDLPLRADVPAEDDPVWRLERQHSRPLALGAVDAAVIHPPADARLEHRLGDLDREHVVLARLDPIEVLGEHAKRSLDRGLDHDRAAGGRSRGLAVAAHSSSLAGCSTTAC